MLCKVTYVCTTRNPAYVNVHCIDETSGKVARCLSKPGVVVGDIVNVRNFHADNGWSSWAFPVKVNEDGRTVEC